MVFYHNGAEKGGKLQKCHSAPEENPSLRGGRTGACTVPAAKSAAFPRGQRAVTDTRERLKLPLSPVRRAADAQSGPESPALHAGPDIAKPLETQCFQGVLWSWKRDSNTRPADYESAALPTELFQPVHLYGRRRGRPKGRLRQRESYYIISPAIRQAFLRSSARLAVHRARMKLSVSAMLSLGSAATSK